MDGQELVGWQQLQAFRSDEFDAAIAPMGSGESIRDLIRRTPQFRGANRAFNAGLITERVIRKFVSDLMREFVSGRKFPFETALAALAVLCESHFAPFAEELLIDLASLKLPEIGHAIRVAQACLQRRIRLPKTRSRTYIVGGDVMWQTQTRFYQVDGARKAQTPMMVRSYAVA